MVYIDSVNIIIATILTMSTSTATESPNAYHHGDLRNALITAGVAMLGEQSAESISLRALAKRAGVSHNAPYQHFADKEALMAAIAEEGFRLLGEAIDAGQAGLADADGIERVIRAGQSYVAFALAHPSHFQLMFSHMAHADYPDLSAESRSAFAKLVAIVAAGQASGELRPGPPEPLALTVWMMVHGLSDVAIAQKLPPGAAGEQSTEDLAAMMVRAACEGLAQ